MCTLTIYSAPKHCIVTMNRDERRTRQESGILHSPDSATKTVYPVDQEAGGTWFGVNEYGVILCLLNQYHSDNVPNPKSRGIIIPQALRLGKFSKVRHCLETMDCRFFNPFDLFLIRKKRIIRFSWDGGDMIIEQVKAKPWFLFSSSSFYTEEVLAYRQSLFWAWAEEMGGMEPDPQEILRGFHMIQLPGMETHSILMEREVSHTKSIIQAETVKQNMSVNYYPNVLENSVETLVTEKLEVLD